MTLSRPFRIQMLYGAPITLYGRTFTPLARVISGGEHRGTVYADRVQGIGWGAAAIQPLALIEKSGGQERRWFIADLTRQVTAIISVIAIVSMIASLATLTLIFIKRQVLT